MNKMLATNFLPYHCCLSAADDNMEKRNISGYLSVDLTDNKITTKNQSRYTYYIKTFHCLSISITHSGFLMVPVSAIK